VFRAHTVRQGRGSRRPDPADLGRLGHLPEARFDEFERRLHLVGVQGLPARKLAPGSGCGDAILGALGDQPPLEMRDGAEHMEDQLAGSG
jgi:hypothetical protein